MRLQHSEQLGMLPHEAEFHTSPILDFRAPATPDVVLALHACDTATDQALAVGIKQVPLFILQRWTFSGGTHPLSVYSECTKCMYVPY